MDSSHLKKDEDNIHWYIIMPSQTISLSKKFDYMKGCDSDGD